MGIQVGDIVEGKITGITKFGAFVELSQAKAGLIHISEVAQGYVKDVNDYLKEHDKIKVKVLNIDEDGKISLSAKRVLSHRATEPKQDHVFGFEDMMKKFIQDSNDKQGEVKRNKEGRKGYK